MTFCVPCLFGLEGIAADELRRMDVQNVRAENGRVLFDGDETSLARANIRLATGERVLLRAGEFYARTFDELFEGVRALEWERFIPRDGGFPVTGYSRDSQLHSVPDCQKIIKKACAVRLTEKYGVETHPESGAEYKIRFSIVGDTASLYLDTSGDGLHKRGYRPQARSRGDGDAVVAAPLRETLAAGLVRIARYRGRETFRDPFCGSGTIAIEAAFAAINRAPGLNRNFAAERWTTLPRGVWDAERAEAKSHEYAGEYDILGSDIDPECVEIARANAVRAGVAEHVRFETADVRQFGESGALVVTNPPYGERVMEKTDAERLYREFGRAVSISGGLKLYILSSHTEFERAFGKRADKKRKLYNGMIKCDLYMYF